MIPNDPAMLLSYLNMKLRDRYDSLEDLCEDMNLDKGSVLQKMQGIQYEYDEELNQFV
jgi:hypothetical protein